MPIFWISPPPTNEDIDTLNEYRYIGEEGFEGASPWECEEGFLKLLGDETEETLEWLEFTIRQLPHLDFIGLECFKEYYLTILNSEVLLQKVPFRYRDPPDRGFDIPVETFLRFLKKGRWGNLEIRGKWEHPEGMRWKDDFDVATGLVSVQYSGGKKKKQYYSDGILVLKIWDGHSNPREMQFLQTGLQPSPSWEWIGYWEEFKSSFYGVKGNLYLTYALGKLVAWGQKSVQTIAEMMFIDTVKNEYEGTPFDRGDFELRCHFREIVRQYRDRIHEVLDSGEWHDYLPSLLQPDDWKSLAPQLQKIGLEAQVFNGLLRSEEARNLAISGLRKSDRDN